MKWLILMLPVLMVIGIIFDPLAKDLKKLGETLPEDEEHERGLMIQCDTCERWLAVGNVAIPWCFLCDRPMKIVNYYWTDNTGDCEQENEHEL